MAPGKCEDDRDTRYNSWPVLSSNARQPSHVPEEPEETQNNVKGSEKLHQSLRMRYNATLSKPATAASMAELDEDEEKSNLDINFGGKSNEASCLK